MIDAYITERLSPLKVKIKKLDPNAVLPQYSKPGDAGMDVTAISIKQTHDYIEYGTGLSFEIPEGYMCQIYPRSSLSNYDLTLCNHVGILDSNYRGELKLRFKKTKEGFNKIYNVGDRIGQIIIMPYPIISFVESDELSNSNRGISGFGSSGV